MVELDDHIEVPCVLDLSVANAACQMPVRFHCDVYLSTFLLQRNSCAD